MYLTFTFLDRRRRDLQEEFAMTYMGSAPQEPGGGTNNRGWCGPFGRGRCGPRWTAIELLAMILGFMVWWPIGLAVIVFKIWQKKTGYQGDLAAAVREKMAEARGFARQWDGAFSRGGFGVRQTGNVAFDEWRTAEINRLEEERRKLEVAEREFADHLANLRRARDREEFDRFMNARRNAPGQGPQA
jgi:hypothetical protein